MLLLDSKINVFYICCVPCTWEVIWKRLSIDKVSIRICKINTISLLSSSWIKIFIKDTGTTEIYFQHQEDWFIFPKEMETHKFGFLYSHGIIADNADCFSLFLFENTTVGVLKKLFYANRFSNITVIPNW